MRAAMRGRGPLKGTVSAQKVVQIYKTKTIDLQEAPKVFNLQSNQRNFTKKP